MSHPQDHEEEKPTDAKNIVIPLGVAFGIITTTLLLCGTGFGTSIWWASRVSSQLETLVKQGADRDAGAVSLGVRTTALELWQHEVSASGTPPMAKEVNDLKAKVALLNESFELYKATNKPKP